MMEKKVFTWEIDKKMAKWRMHERTNKPTNKQTNEPKSPSVLLDIVFFGAAAKKRSWRL